MADGYLSYAVVADHETVGPVVLAATQFRREAETFIVAQGQTYGPLRVVPLAQSALVFLPAS